MKNTFLRACILIGAVAGSSAAHAHPGHGEGVLAGLLHPLLGLDHLLAMLAIGLWASQLKGRTPALLFASFIGAMGLAALVVVMGAAQTLGEPGMVGEFGIVCSLMLAGLLLAFRVQLAPLAGAAVAGLFALFHGYAHGAEVPGGAVVWQYFAGFLLASLVLLHAGRVLGLMLARWKAALPAAGAFVFLSGGVMMAGLG